MKIDNNTADTTTWRIAAQVWPDLAACDGLQMIDVLERDIHTEQLHRSETEYMGKGNFYPMKGQAVYWCYQRPLPVEYTTEEEAMTGLDTCGYWGKWNKAKESVYRDQPDLAMPDHWNAVRLHFLELGGCYLSERSEPAPTEAVPQRSLPIIPRLPYQEPMKVRQG